MSFQGDSIFWVEVDKVVPNPFQPRREFDEERLRELADSIRMYGVLQPLTVTRREVHNDDGSFRTEYELIAGERRWRASKLAGVAQVPVIIRSGEQTEQEKLELAIIENLQREDLNAVDRALAFKQLADTFDLSHSQVAKKVGRSREYVSNSIRLLALPEHILDGLKRGDISEGHARTLLMLKDKPEEQDVLYREILLKKLSVREVERISRKIANDKVRKKHKDTDAHLIEIEREFTDTLGTRVQILKTDYGGKLTIDYFSDDDLGTLLEAMKKQHAHISTPTPEANNVSPASDAVGETVVREMDSGAVATLADSTPLTPAEDVSGEKPGESEVTQPQETTPEQTEPAVDLVEKNVLNTADEDEHIDKPEAPAVTPVVPDTSSHTPSGETVPKVMGTPEMEHEATAPAAPQPQPDSNSPSNSDEPTSHGVDAASPNTELRARLEAELARLDEAEQDSTNAQTTKESPVEPAAASDTPGAHEKTPEQPNEKDTDDDLYSIRNFSL